MREPPGQHVTEQTQAALVERYLRRIGGGVHVSELAYQTGLPESVVVDALYELEQQGQAAPWAWTVGPKAAQRPPTPSGPAFVGAGHHGREPSATPTEAENMPPADAEDRYLVNESGRHLDALGSLSDWRER